MLRHGRMALVVVLLILVQSGGAQPTPVPTLFDLTLRRAEDAMESGRYTEAITLYEQVLALPVRTDESVPFAQTRLGLVYLLTGQPQQAENIFGQIIPPAITHNGDNAEWINAVHDAWQHDSRLLHVCQVAYARAYDSLDYDFNMYPEFVNPYHYGPDSHLSGMDIAPLSCDFPVLLERELANLEFSTDTPPTEQLQSAGLILRDHLSLDLDGDNEAEWIIWLDSPQLEPLVFVPVNQVRYVVSRPRGSAQGPDYYLNSAMRLPAPDNQYWVAALPDGTHALVNVDFGSDYYDSYTIEIGLSGVELSCMMGSVAPGRPGDVTLWRLEEQKLRQFFYALRCEYAIPESLFPGGEGSTELIAAYEYYLDKWNVELRPATYSWDASRHTFVLVQDQ